VGTLIGRRGTGGRDLERRVGHAKRLGAAHPVPGTKRRGVPSGVGVLRSSPQRDGEPTPRTGFGPPLWTACPLSPMWRDGCPRERAKHRARRRPHRGVSPVRGVEATAGSTEAAARGHPGERAKCVGGLARAPWHFARSRIPVPTTDHRPPTTDPDPTRPRPRPRPRPDPDLTSDPPNRPLTRPTHPDRHSRDPSRARSLQ